MKYDALMAFIPYFVPRVDAGGYTETLRQCPRAIILLWYPAQVLEERVCGKTGMVVV
jgi:hypothetical protein